MEFSRKLVYAKGISQLIFIIGTKCQISDNISYMSIPYFGWFKRNSSIQNCKTIFLYIENCSFY